MTKLGGTVLRVSDQNLITIQQTKRGLGTILWAIDENTGTNLQAFYKHFTPAVWKHKNSNYIL